MSAPETLEEFEALKARVALIEANLRHSLHGEKMKVQLDALLSAYVNLAVLHGQAHEAGECLLHIGAALINPQLNAAAPAAQDRPADAPVH